MQQQQVIETRWHKPHIGRYKCNIDASFSVQHNKVGIEMCIRDDQGQFVLAKTEWMSPIADTDIGEALGLLSALNWFHVLQLENVDFELDSKNVVTSFHSKRNNVSGLGDIIRDCVRLHKTYFRNSNVEFIRRQPNEVAHVLARVVTSTASFHIFIDIPTCITFLIIKCYKPFTFKKKKSLRPTSQTNIYMPK
jgi:ribonuclease HI